MAAPDTTDRPRQLRILRLALGLIVIEAGLVIVGHVAPAMRALIRPVYLIVVLVFAVAMLQAARGRNGDDRRHGERRHDDL